MRRICLISALALASAFAVNAQSYYPNNKNSEILHHSERGEAFRKEIILPQVNGYNVYKADLHTHTIHSDADATVAFRVNEAWYDGLDILAITDHIEYRSRERILVNYLQKYLAEDHKKAVNWRIDQTPLKEGEIMVDLNFSCKEACRYAEKYGMLIIPGTEITRDGKTVGHFNALFTADNNLIYHPDPVQAARNAKAQNALVMHNHPGWQRTNIDYTPAETAMYAEGLIDGVEVMNTDEFYPGVIDRVREKGLFISANTDIHSSTAYDYRYNGFDRMMTLILAKERTLEAVREALEARRTLAYGYNTLCGDEQLLKDFFAAGVKLTVMHRGKSSANVAITNMTSIPYTIRQEGANQCKLNPFQTLWFTVSNDKSTLDFEVLNMFCSKEGHPVVQLVY